MAMIGFEFCAAIVALLLVPIIYRQYSKEERLSDVPLVGSDGVGASSHYVSGAKGIIAQGYQKLRNGLGLFKLWTPNGYMCVPSQAHLAELKDLGDDKVDETAPTDRIIMTKYTGLTRYELGVKLVRQDLTQNLGKLVPTVMTEVGYAFDKEWPSCPDWTSVNVFSKLLRVIALVGGSVLSGPQLNRNEEWMDLSINYTVDLMKGARRLKEYPSYLHPIVQYFLPEVRKMSHYYSSARRLVLPILKERAEAAKDAGYIKPNDLLQWTVDKNKLERNKLSLNQQAEIQLMAAFASIHTTSMACSHALYDLAAYPECLEPLRREITSVLAGDGTINKQSLTKLQKLDSFMKESQRMNPPGIVAFHRDLRQPITLKDGSHFPAGSQFAFPAAEISMDPNIFPNPEIFDAFRFYNLRQQSAEHANRHQHVTVDSNSLHWGYGKHACPGRFFANQEIKLILAHVIQNYDVKLADDTKGRPANWIFETQVMPDPTVMIQFKKAVL